jgi:hypothetical protein
VNHRLIMRIDFRQVLAVVGGAVATASLFVSETAVPHAQPSAARAASAVAATTADNALTAQERATGWTLLFDGKTTSGKALVANSKFKQWPSYGLSKSGHIGLQDHGNAVAFKNVKIRVLK